MIGVVASLLCFLIAPALEAREVLPLRTEQDLRAIESCLNCSYALVNNITVTTAWLPLGNATVAFTGSIDGLGNAIDVRDLQPKDGVVGLFASAGNANFTQLTVSLSTNVTAAEPLTVGGLAATLTNVMVYGCVISFNAIANTSGSNLSIGCMAGLASTVSLNMSTVMCSLAVNNSGSTTLGGVAATLGSSNLTGSVVNLTTTSTSTAAVNAGTVCGFASSVLVKESTLIGTVSLSHPGSQCNVGAFGSFLPQADGSSTVVECTIETLVSITNAQSVSAGQLAGTVQAQLSVSNVSAMGSVNIAAQTLSVGGLIGNISASVAINATTVSLRPSVCTATGALSGAGFIGAGTDASNITATMCYASGGLTVYGAPLSVGGFSASASNMAATKCGTNINITAVGTSSGEVKVGGFMSSGADSNMEYNYATGSLNVTGLGKTYVGGLVGYQKAKSILNCYANTLIVAAGPTVYAGGFTGSFSSASPITSRVINNSYASGSLLCNLTNGGACGGFLGYLGYRGSIANSFAYVTLTAVESGGQPVIGGFVGLQDSVQLTPYNSITGCYAAGSVTTNFSAYDRYAYQGGFIGYLQLGSITDCVTYSNVVVEGVSKYVGLFVGYAGGFSYFTYSYITNGLALGSVAVPAGSAAVSFYGVQSYCTSTRIYCLQQEGTAGCAETTNLKSAEYLGDAFMANFYLNQSVGFGFPSLLRVPSPASTSLQKEALSGSAPLVVSHAGAATDGYWSSQAWTLDSGDNLGMPALAGIPYTELVCNPATGCNGQSSSPLTVTCAPRWSSPAGPATNTAGTPLSEYLSALGAYQASTACTVFRCTADADCAGGAACQSGRCLCPAGRFGPDCATEACLHAGTPACASNTCFVLDSSDGMGYCKCNESSYLTIDGQCVEGCTDIHHAYCVGKDTFICEPGWTQESNCTVYNCTAAEGSASVCNDNGKCVQGKCVCNKGHILASTTCYPICAPNSTTLKHSNQFMMQPATCIHADCGDDTACGGFGSCEYNHTTKTGLCVCDEKATNRTGKYCTECIPGTILYNDTCVHDSCGVCAGGDCKFVNGQRVCVCPSGDYVLMDDRCILNKCGPCDGGKCEVADSVLVCKCTSEKDFLYNDKCIPDTCGLCDHGTCVVSASESVRECKCDASYTLVDGICEAVNKESSRVPIIIACTVVGAILLIVAVVVTSVLVVRHRKKVRDQRNAHVSMSESLALPLASENASFNQLTI